MLVRVLFFASFRDAAGRKEEDRELPAGSRVSDLWSSLSRDIAALSRFAVMPPAAVNREYVPAGTELHDGDEVAFLPAVAGG